MERHATANEEARHFMRRAIIWLGLALAIAGCGSSSVSAPGATTVTPHPTPGVSGWPQFDYDGQHSGVNPNETQLSLSNVSKLHRLWAVKLPATADSTPVLIGSVRQPDSKQGAVIYVTTLSGTLVALDAATGAQLWQRTTQGPKLTNSSPAVDPSGRYVYSYGLDGKVHKYDAASGNEVTGNGWPLTTTLMTDVEKESSALTIANGRLYVTTSGYIGDGGHYEGHVVSMPLAGGTPAVWNALCSDIHTLLGPTPGQPNYCADRQAGIWARAGTVADPVTGNVYVVTGNGPYTANTGGTDWGDSVIALSADLSHVVDAYTPTDQQVLNTTDVDLGSTTPALLPRIPNSKTPLLAVQGGKDGILRLLNRQNLSGQGGPGHLGGEVATFGVPGPGGKDLVFTQPAVWADSSGTVWVFVVDSFGTAGYQVQTDSSGKTTLHQAWLIDQGGNSPVIANGVLYVPDSGKILALNPQTGKTVWDSSSASAGGSIGDIHWESPIVVNGQLYMTDESGNLYAYEL
jgi:outer membrane protein assembly factor BamB